MLLLKGRYVARTWALGTNLGNEHLFEYEAKVVHGGEVCKNPYYVPPEDFLNPR